MWCIRGTVRACTPAEDSWRVEQINGGNSSVSYRDSVATWFVAPRQENSDKVSFCFGGDIF